MSDIKNPLLTDSEVHAAEDVTVEGKARRNYKSTLYLVIGAAIVIGLFWQSIFPNKEKKVAIKAPEVVQADLAREMEEQAKRNKKPDVPTPVPVVAASLKEPEADNSAEKELQRKQLIVASGMDSGDFNLSPSASRLTAAKPSASDAVRADQKKLQDRLLSNSERVIDAALKGNEPPAAALNRDDAYLGKHSKDTYEEAVQVRAAHRGHALYQGHLIRTVLERGINSDLPGSILARVVSDVFDSVDGRILLIPKGTVIYGDHSAEVGVGQSRMLVAADRMIFPNGKSASLQKSTVSDMTGYAGIESKVDNHFFQMFGTSLIVGAASWLMPVSDQSTSTTTGAGGTTTGGSIIAQALGGATKAIGERNKSIKPTLTVGQGEMFLITLGRDVILPEYIK